MFSFFDDSKYYTYYDEERTTIIIPEKKIESIKSDHNKLQESSSFNQNQTL